MVSETLKSLAPLLTVACGIGLYQVCLKRLPQGDYPFHLLSIIYTLSAALSLVLGRLFPSQTDPLQFMKKGYVGVLLLGVAPVLIEVGYLWAYRSGWKLGLLNVVVSAACVVLMLAVGYMLFSERVTATQVVGGALCVAGLVLASSNA